MQILSKYDASTVQVNIVQYFGDEKYALFLGVLHFKK